jgi:hypothetical protein
MKDDWIHHCLEMSARPADMYSGCRKIIFGHMLTFHEVFDAPDPIVLEDAGYTRNKMSHLTRGYLHPESKEVAIKLWDLRRTKPSYGSVGMTTYNHFLKNDMVKKSKRASVMGPCIQSLVVTQVKGGKNPSYRLDAFYRTTELLKKFPADLVFIREVLLEGFNFEGMEFLGLNCHFANITIHPQYFVTLIPSLEDPIRELERIKAVDPFFYNWIIKWTSRYLVAEHFRGIEKFAQAMRVKVDADLRIKGWRRKELIKYLEANHPGHNRAYVSRDGAEDGDDE